MKLQTLVSQFPNSLNIDLELQDGYNDFVSKVINIVESIETSPTARAIGITRLNLSSPFISSEGYDKQRNIVYLPVKHKDIERIFICVHDYYFDDNDLMVITYSVGFQYSNDIIVYDARRLNAHTDDIETIVRKHTRGARYHARLVERHPDIIDFSKVFVTLDKHVPANFNHYPTDAIDKGVDDEPTIFDETNGTWKFTTENEESVENDTPIESEEPIVNINRTDMELRLSNLMHGLHVDNDMALQRFGVILNTLVVSHETQYSRIVDLVGLNKSLMAEVRLMREELNMMAIQQAFMSQQPQWGYNPQQPQQGYNPYTQQGHHKQYPQFGPGGHPQQGYPQYASPFGHQQQPQPGQQQQPQPGQQQQPQPGQQRDWSQHYRGPNENKK